MEPRLEDLIFESDTIKRYLLTQDKNDIPLIVKEEKYTRQSVLYKLGRDEKLRQRRLNLDTNGLISSGVLKVEQILEKIDNPSSLVYPTIIGIENGKIVASSGPQTLSLYNSARANSKSQLTAILMKAGTDPEYSGSKEIITHEQDYPHYTQRLLGCLDQEKNKGGFYSIRKATPGYPIHNLCEFYLNKGEAKTITTYSGGNEKVLLPFTGEVLESKVEFTSASGIAESLYGAMRGSGSEDYRIACGVIIMNQGIRFHSAAINRFEKGE